MKKRLRLIIALATIGCSISLVFAQPNVSKKRFQLFLLTGQSNMAGRGAIDSPQTQTNSHIWMLDKNNNWVPAKEPLHFDKPIAGVGPGLAFAQTLLATDTSQFIGLIPCAVGGSPISVWQPGKYYEATQTYPYDEALKRATVAMQSGTLKAILWHQGESDSDSLHAPLYAANLATLVKRFRTNLHAKKLPFIAGTLGDFYVAGHPYATVINQAIEALPLQTRHSIIVSAAGLVHKGDNTHFNTESARLLGQRYAAAYLNMLRR